MAELTPVLQIRGVVKQQKPSAGGRHRMATPPTPAKRVLSGESSTTKSEPQRGPHDLLIDDGKSWKNTREKTPLAARMD